MTRSNSTKWQITIERILLWFVLSVLIIFTYAKFVAIPYIGFGFLNGEVTDVFTLSGDKAIQVGDRIISVDQVLVEEFLENTHLAIFSGLHKGDIVSLVLEQGEEIIEIEWIVPGIDRIQLLERFNDIWWFPYVFFVAGTATLLFIRPKDTRWKLLIAFNFLTAIWLVAGSGPSQWQIWESAVIMRSVIWLCLPIYIHFHWEFPSKLGYIPNSLWRIIYITAFAFAIFEWFQFLPRTAFYFGFLFAVGGSVLLLFAHALFQKEYRRDILTLGLASLLIVLPSLVFALVGLLGSSSPRFTGGSLLAFPALPGAYFFIAYRHQLSRIDQRFIRITRIYIATIVVGTFLVGLLFLVDSNGNLSETTFGAGMVITIVATISALTGFSPFLALPALAGERIALRARSGDIEIRANRLLSLYLFVVIEGLIISSWIVIVENLFSFPGKTFVIGVGAALLGSTITVIGYTPFRRFIDQHILGIKLPPEKLLQSYSDRIITSLEHQNLVQLLNTELLPSLLIRQSVILRIHELNTQPFITLGVVNTQIPSGTEIQRFLAQTGKLLMSDPTTSTPYDWIRLVLPFEINGKLIGLWLFGKRDPEDYYSQAEISLLQTLANQTAIALINIQQSERLHSLYQSNIDSHERERTALAHGLHDDVLGQLTALTLINTSTTSVEFQENFHRVTSRIRQMISGLRPTMLDYGLRLALDEYIDELSERYLDGPSITLSVPSSGIRYEPKVEEQLFRIIQQACENACRHAHAQTIQVHGILEQDRIALVVKDDGIGFELEQLDFNTLLSEKHFGLVGMFERSAIIGANLKLVSARKNGTEVKVSWTSSLEN
ncbi:MAG: hypothetical protein GY755_02520 [Chloroflexi bacterium]|nr:hypothetical protein [Chloroflexota bacterium]